jgi:hypothetical protein
MHMGETYKLKRHQYVPKPHKEPTTTMFVLIGRQKVSGSEE